MLDILPCCCKESLVTVCIIRERKSWIRWSEEGKTNQKRQIKVALRVYIYSILYPPPAPFLYIQNFSSSKEASKHKMIYQKKKKTLAQKI